MRVPDKGKSQLSQKGSGESSLYISQKEIAMRWQCARSTVDRAARRAGLARFCLGDGRNGMIRYLRKEVEQYEEKRRA